VQLQSRPFKIRRIIVRLDTATVVYHSTNVPVRTRTRLHDGLLAYVTYGPQFGGAVNGLPVRPGLLLSVESGVDHLLVTGENFESIAFLLPRDDVRAHLMVRGRGAEFHVPEGIEPLQVDPAESRRIVRMGQAARIGRAAAAYDVRRRLQGTHRRSRGSLRDRSVEQSA